MEASREIYWDVGPGVTGAMYLLTALSLGHCGWGFYLRIPAYRQGRGLNRLDRAVRRVKLLLVAIFGQLRVLPVPLPGMLHAQFFWGFLPLFIGTLLVMIQADLTDPFFRTAF